MQDIFYKEEQEKSTSKLKLLIIFLVLSFIVFSSLWFTRQPVAQITVHPDIQQLIRAPIKPQGLVLDVESNNPEFWIKNSNYVIAQIEAVRKKIPTIDIVVLSHGRELTSLVESQVAQTPELKLTFNQLNHFGVNLSVCSVTSKWQNINTKLYPEFISITDSAPAERNHYKQLGYDVVYLDKFNKEQAKQFLQDAQKYR